jgi:hypothetical protein
MAFAEDMATPEIAGLRAAETRASPAYGRRFDEVKESPTMMLSMKSMRAAAAPIGAAVFGKMTVWRKSDAAQAGMGHKSARHPPRGLIFSGS